MRKRERKRLGQAEHRSGRCWTAGSTLFPVVGRLEAAVAEKEKSTKTG